MHNKAMDYLLSNSILHMSMIEPIRRNTADILYADIDGVLIKETISNAYMISVVNIEKGKELLDNIKDCNLILAHQKLLVDYIVDKFKLKKVQECFQFVYMNKTMLKVNEELEIKKMEPYQKDIILENYKELSSYEVNELLNLGNIFGGYKDGTLIGFIGNHLEGGIGLLEVFPLFRRKGYGTILESFIVNQMLEDGLVPYGQVFSDNHKSISLQKNLGFNISEEKLYWVL